MQISFAPQRADQPLTLARKGGALIINGTSYDFSPLPEGAVLPRAAVDCAWLASDVTRIGGILQLTLLLPHGANAPHETLFPAAVDLAVDGAAALPPFDAEVSA